MRRGKADGEKVNRTGWFSFRLTMDSITTVNAGLTASKHCCIEMASSDIEMLVKARSSVTRTVTSANPIPFFLQFSTPHVLGLMRKTGISITQVNQHDVQDSATGVDALFSRTFVSIVLITAIAT